MNKKGARQHTMKHSHLDYWITIMLSQNLYIEVNLSVDFHNKLSQAQSKLKKAHIWLKFWSSYWSDFFYLYFFSVFVFV